MENQAGSRESQVLSGDGAYAEALRVLTATILAPGDSDVAAFDRDAALAEYHELTGHAFDLNLGPHI